MQSGDLRSRVGFYQRATVSDGYGNTQGAFGAEPVFEARANIRPRLGGEDVLAGRLAGRNLVNITVRRDTNSEMVSVDWMAKDERSGETYNIRSIVDPQQGGPRHGRYLEMLCEKGVAL